MGKIIVVLLFLGFLTGKCHGELISHHWKNAQLLQIDKQSLFNNYTARSSIACANLCQTTGNCDSFSYDKSANSCIGFSSQNSNTSTPVTVSMKYYVNENTILGMSHNFMQYSFTTCNNTGPTGPTLANCTFYYNTPWAFDTHIFDVTFSGVQKWKVPQTGFYRIEAYGAAGGYSDTSLDTNSGSHIAGGKGAMIQGTFFLESGTILNIICGHMGSNGTWSEPGGGGGGSFVYTGNIGGTGLLIAAGGGGGAGEEDTDTGYDGQNENQSFNGSSLVGSSINENGGEGYGGVGGSFTSTGAGWYSDGENMTSINNGNPGTRWDGGSQVKVPYSESYLISGAGGFGGGGSGVISNGGGGGGGYTGGSGTSVTTRSLWGGSGGGSYNGGTDQINESGYNDDHGYVNIIPL